MNDILGRLTTSLEGRYTIERELGAGGMATVYLAHDVRHDRKVALKVLRPELAAILGAARFLAEIRTTANLQHPHILSLFDSGDADGTVFYVMPYVEGESLRDRLAREKQLPVDDAVRVAREVADALNYAHTQGVIHRDIKPENILLHGGHAMVADFGIALAASRIEGASRMTETGMSLGTPAYMAPEQAMGERDITPKADIYALGALLYEMLSGEPPFVGPTAQAILARVMTEEPRPLTLHRHTIPPHVEAAVRKALEKLPADRFATAADLAAALADPAFGPSAPRPAARAVSRGPVPRWSGVAVMPWALLVVVAIVGAWGAFRERPGPVHPVIRFTMELTAPGGAIGDATDFTAGSPLALSPDGSRIAFAAQTPGEQQTRLFVRAFDGGAPTAIAGSEGARQPFFSPDGRSIGFIAGTGSRVSRVDAAGGAVVPLASLTQNPMGAAWGSRGTIVVSVGGALLRIRETGGAIDTVVRPDSGVTAQWPEFLPGGRIVLYSASRGGATELRVLWLESGEHRPLGVAGSNPRYVGRGWLLYESGDGNLFAVRFDERRVRVTGPAVAVAGGVRVGDGVEAWMGHSRTGTVAFLPGGGQGRDLVVVDRAGTSRVLPAPPNRYQMPRFSPDGRRIAVGVGIPDNGDIWVYGVARSTLSRVTFDHASAYPEWSPDGAWVYFATNRTGDRDLWRTRADGSAVEEPVVVAPRDQWEVAPSRDGRGIVFRASNPETRRDIYWLSAGSTAAIPILRTPFDERAPALSPDGKWLAYMSNETGSDEVYVRSLSDSGGRVQLSSGGGFAPRWGIGGREVLFCTRDSVYSVPVRVSGGEIHASEAHALFANTYMAGGVGNHAGWDVSPDGRQFVFVRARPGAAPVQVLLHWFDQPR